MTMNKRRRIQRADRRVVRVCYPTGQVVGFYVRPMRAAMPMAGPMLDYDDALVTALAESEGLVRGWIARDARV